MDEGGKGRGRRGPGGPRPFGVSFGSPPPPLLPLRCHLFGFSFFPVRSRWPLHLRCFRFVGLVFFSVHAALPD